MATRGMTGHRTGPVQMRSTLLEPGLFGCVSRQLALSLILVSPLDLHGEQQYLALASGH